MTEYKNIRTVFFAAALAILSLIVMLAPQPAAAAHTSSICPSQSATVANGASVQINLNACHNNILFPPFGLGQISGPGAPAHGTAVLGELFTPPSTYDAFVTYTHNGDSATSDSFEFEDENGDIIHVDMTITPPTSAITVTPSSLPTLTAGNAFSQALSSAGGTGPYTYTLESGTLPPGLSLSSGGVLSGTPTQRGGYTFSVRSTDSLGDYTAKAYSGSVQNPSLSMTSGATALQGSAFSEALSVTGGVAPYTFQIETGSLPSGITLSSGGVLSGTTSAALGSYPVTIRVTDASTGPGAYFELESFTLTVATAPSVTITSSPIAFAENAGSTFTFTATRSAALSSPTVVNITTTGAATSGVDYTGGASTITIPANSTTGALVITPVPDSIPETDEMVIITLASGTGYTIGSPSSAWVIIQNDDAQLAISPSSLSNGTAGSAYSQTLSTTNGTAPYTYTITSGALPAGLSLTSGGVLSGTPTATGSFSFDVLATDSSPSPGPATNTISYTLTINAPTITLPTTTLTTAQQNVAYSASLNPATGGTAPYSYAVTSGALPSGVTLSSSGALSGTPTANGTFNFTVTATDSTTGGGPYTASQSYSLTVSANPPVANAVSANIAYNAPATAVTLNITGGAATSVAVASAPSHGTAIASGTGITYQPAAGYSGPDSFTYTATNGTGTSAAATVSVTVLSPTLTVSAGDPLTTQVGDYYTQTFTFSGGTAPYTSANVTGFPSGMSVTGSTATTVTIYGRPVQAGSFTLTVTATDSSSGSGPFAASDTFTLNVGAPTLVLSPAAGNLSATYATSYTRIFSTSGGTSSYNYALSGTLPTGLAFNPSSGVLTGTPVQSGSFPITVTATDSGSGGAGAPFSVSENYTLIVSSPSIVVSPSTLTTGAVGTSYSAQLNAAGGVGPYAYAISSGSLPAGLSLSSAGLVSGTPTATGTVSFDVTATDANSQSSITTISLTINGPTLALSPGGLPTATINTAYSQTLTASGGTAPYTYTVTAGALPAGITLSSGGVLSGTPTAAGSSSFDVTATDSTGGTPGTITVSYTLDVSTRPNPSQNAEVTGVSNAQVQTAERFSSAQVFNFMERLTQVLDAPSPGGFQMGLRLSMPTTCSNPEASAYGRSCTDSTLALGDMLKGLQGQAPGVSASGDTDALNDGHSSNPWTVWTGGTVRIGEVGASSSGAQSYDFQSEGISIGMDRKFTPDFAAGFGVGAGRETADIGENGSRNKSTSKVFAIYGSHALGDIFRLDALVGHQWMDFDIRRYVNPGLTIDGSDRSGSQWFGALSARAEIENSGWLLSPYARAQASRATLDAYQENSGTPFDLSYAKQDVDSTALSFGSRVAYPTVISGYRLLPSVQVEYQHEFEKSDQARAAYVDTLPGPLTALSTEGLARNQLMVGTGIGVQVAPFTNLQLDYMMRHYSNVETDQTFQMMIKHHF